MRKGGGKASGECQEDLALGDIVQESKRLALRFLMWKKPDVYETMEGRGYRRTVL